MKLTGKCKEAFEVWAAESKKYKFKYINNVLCIKIDSFWITWGKVPNSMQYGVYVDFADSVGIDIKDVPYRLRDDTVKYIFSVVSYSTKLKSEIKDILPTRHEARTAAVEKFNELYNKRFQNDKFLAC